jgi:protein TonB
MTRFAMSGPLHLLMLALVISALRWSTVLPVKRGTDFSHLQVALPDLVYTAQDRQGGGGGGGGTQHSEPIRRAQAIGDDPMTLPVAKPVAFMADPAPDVPTPLQQLLIDAKPVASGVSVQIGLPADGPSLGSAGPGTGKGVGNGNDEGIGGGRGKGVGDGLVQGMNGPYQAGNGVTNPRLLTHVEPVYTAMALKRKVQGAVLLEAVVDSNGRPTALRVLHALDPELDEQAIIAVRQWRFEPGRLAGKPVDVLVTVQLDFSIR